MNYFLDLNRNTPRKDTLTIAYINDCKPDNPQTSTNNQNDRVAIETNKSNLCMLVRPTNQSHHIYQYFFISESSLSISSIISEFKKKTGCPVLVNTSFNVRGEPIVNTPEDAFNCFMGTELDVLAIGNCYLNKENQIKSLKKDYKTKYELD